jgi:hypothetical protein
MSTVKDYDGPKVRHDMSHKDMATVLTAVHRYKSVQRVPLSIAEIMTDVCKDSVCAQIQSERVTSGYTKEYTRMDLEKESDGILIQAVLERIKPVTAHAYQAILTREKMRIPGSTMLLKFSKETQTAMMEYVASFMAIWGLLRFDAEAYDDRGESHGAGKYPADFEPTLTKSMGEAPKTGRYGAKTRTKLLSLESMFLDGHPDNFGSDMYQLFGFNTNAKKGTEQAGKNVKHLDMATFAATWRTEIMRQAQVCKDIGPLARALAGLNATHGGSGYPIREREADKSGERPKYTDRSKFPYRGGDRQQSKDVVAAVTGESPMCQTCDQVYAIEDKNLGFCLAMIQGRNCRDGVNCPYGHSEAQYREFSKTQGMNFRPVNGWKPSPERHQRLVPNNSFKPKTFVHGEVRVVPRPQAVVNEVNEQESDSEGEEERRNDRELERVTSGHDTDYSDSNC